VLLLLELAPSDEELDDDPSDELLEDELDEELLDEELDSPVVLTQLPPLREVMSAGERTPV
jgi:hypothetical protein